MNNAAPPPKPATSAASSGLRHVAAYHFTRIAQPVDWQTAIAERAAALALKGTVLLAHEGINLYLAGATADVAALCAWLVSDARFKGRLVAMPLKLTVSAQMPYKKLLVKVKDEIIRMNMPSIVPDFGAAEGRAPAVDAQTLARWLANGRDDEGREVVTLDTRNAFEVDYGKFEGATDWHIDKFSDFPAALAAHRSELEGKTVVSYCTGGIRCEKAALHMRALGMDHVYQLDGGIIKYFQETQGAHYQGSCFVFDGREALGPDLAQAPACELKR